MFDAIASLLRESNAVSTNKLHVGRVPNIDVAVGISHVVHAKKCSVQPGTTIGTPGSRLARRIVRKVLTLATLGADVNSFKTKF